MGDMHMAEVLLQLILCFYSLLLKFTSGTPSGLVHSIWPSSDNEKIIITSLIEYRFIFITDVKCVHSIREH